MPLEVIGEGAEARSIPVRAPMFSAAQITYLSGLPAVISVGPSRIRYAKGFQRACLRRYLNGANPTDLFRKAGLDPAVIGAKRIERCFQRWRSNAALLLESDDAGDDERFFVAGTPAQSGAGVRLTASDARAGAGGREGTDCGGYGYSPGRVIDQLSRYVDRLEKENSMLRERLGMTDRPNEEQSARQESEGQEA
ncbi:hypothetical protein [Bifidobacterium parmae]|uniref:Uncharacterized protein n=1 Tax=Bifidobacterium parmae TaxID=361854 RepID=A0A2N5J5F6_9BIFI|nr:hypothetical protein [Bifidobacterium parmae]PLS29444.1 hypothetical protein Uis4E_0318 [Bifidobacterium parmae]